MSFCNDIKKELAARENEARHCQIAEFTAILSICGRLYETNAVIKSENILLIKRADSLLRDAFGKKFDLSVYKKKPASGRHYELTLSGGTYLDIKNAANPENSYITSAICCKKAYIRGAFLASGLITDPEKAYHAEFKLEDATLAKTLLHLLNVFVTGAKLRQNAKEHSVYIKDSDSISDLLKILGANDAVLDLEGIRVFRDINNNINRRANCDTANFDKTASASANSVLQIEYIKANRGLYFLPPHLKEIAVLRLKNTEASLSELGDMLKPPLSKSAVNHRLRKIGAIAAELGYKQP